MTGLIPTAAAASMIGVVGKQNRLEMPSFFRISAITFMTSIGRSSRLIALLDEIECSFIGDQRQPGVTRKPMPDTVCAVVVGNGSGPDFTPLLVDPGVVGRRAGLPAG
jgi:hypothetical protein